MNQKNPVTFFLSLLAFLVLGGISCWATSESLFLSFRGGAAFPKIVFWVIVILFFIVTSLGTKMIIDSFSSTKSIEPVKRRLMLIGGILIVICFWLLVSMPTNAHTFLYKRSARTVAQKELKWQEGQLQAQPSDEETWVLHHAVAITKVLQEVDALKENLIAEIRHYERKGFSVKAESILQDIERKLEMPNPIPRTSNNNLSEKEINRVTEYYSRAIDSQKEVYQAAKLAELASKAEEHSQEIKDCRDAIKYTRAVYAALDADDEVQEEVLRQARKYINHNYEVLDVVNVTSESSRDQYVNVKKGMPSNRLTNVVEVVYKDYLSGKLSTKYDMPETKGMIYFILLSILIDFAAFLFFNIAFKN